MLEAIGIIAVSLALLATTWTGLVVAALSNFNSCKTTFFTGLGIAGLGFACLVTFLSKSLTIA